MVMAVATSVSATTVRAIVRMFVIVMRVVVRLVMRVGSVCHRFAGDCRKIYLGETTPATCCSGSPSAGDGLAAHGKRKKCRIPPMGRSTSRIATSRRRATVFHNGRQECRAPFGEIPSCAT
jgi:hypothetical protein